MERYAHMIKCQQCENLSSTGQCTRKQGIKPIPDALRTCDKFSLLKGERELIQGQNYTPSEINSLIERYEKPLFYHALDCSICHIEKARYCANGYAIGSVYDALLLVCEDAQARREDLALRIDRACISGRSVFEAFNPANVQHTLISSLQRQNMAIVQTMRRLSITGQLAKCASLILVGIASRGKN
jgi:hypothetical protein